MKTINHRLIYQLRQATLPVPENDLVHLYQEPDQLYHDLSVLQARRLVRADGQGVAWAGS